MSRNATGFRVMDVRPCYDIVANLVQVDMQRRDRL